VTKTPEPEQEDATPPWPRAPVPKHSSSMTQRLSLEKALDATDVDARAAMRRTAHISLRPGALEELSGPAPTRRKTIRVKKPTGPATVSAAEGADTDVWPVAARPAVAFEGRKQSPWPVPVEASPSPIFLVAAAAAILAECVLIYILAAQVIGPNDSLAPLSYCPSGPRLPWPGRIGGDAH
jgi:hypothetical protein